MSDRTQIGAEMQHPVTVIGETPSIVGSPCEELLAQEYWHKGELVEPANVIYPRFGGAWHRLCLDSPVVFWRRIPAPDPPTGEEGSAYPLVDLGKRCGVRGIVLDRLEVTSIEGGSEVRFGFRNYAELLFDPEAA
jgi:hypothetical protein